MQPLIIFPFNGNGREALDCIGGNYDLIGFIDDTPEKQGMSMLGYPVFGREALDQFPNAKVLAVPGGPSSFQQRASYIEGLNIPVERFATVIHPNASVSKFASVGRNVLLMAGVVVTSNTVISDHVCVLPNSVIHHDTVVGEWTLIGSNVVIAGNVKVGKNCYIGSGTNIMNGLEIGEGSLVGLGANVIRNVHQQSRVAGNPSKEIITSVK